MQRFFHLTHKLTTEIPEARFVIVNPRQRAAKLHSFNPESCRQKSCTNPLSCAAGYFAIDEIVRQDAAVKAGENGDKLRAGIQKLIDKYDLPFVTWNTGSIVHFEVSGVMYLDASDPDIFTKIPERQKYIEEFGAALTANGVITLAGSRIYTSMADNDETIAQTLSAFEEVFSNVER